MLGREEPGRKEQVRGWLETTDLLGVRKLLYPRKVVGGGEQLWAGARPLALPP